MGHDWFRIDYFRLNLHLIIEILVHICWRNEFIIVRSLCWEITRNNSVNYFEFCPVFDKDCLHFRKCDASAPPPCQVPIRWYFSLIIIKDHFWNLQKEKVFRVSCQYCIQNGLPTDFYSSVHSNQRFSFLNNKVKRNIEKYQWNTKYLMKMNHIYNHFLLMSFKSFFVYSTMLNYINAPH